MVCDNVATIPCELQVAMDDRVEELRRKLGDFLNAKYGTDFNLRRWLMNADNHVDVAERQLRNHLRFRRAMRLDEIEIPSIEENPMFKDRLLPKGSMTWMESKNRWLWWTDYATTDMAGIIKGRPTSAMLTGHFYLYERLLEAVNERERLTGRMSGIDAVIDLADYNMNPFAALIVNNGQLNYYITTFHYEHYPHLVAPLWVVNIPKWIYYPYKAARMFLPKDITEKIRLLDGNFKHTFVQTYDRKELPMSLGGDLRDDHLLTVPAKRLEPHEYYKPCGDDPLPEECSNVVVNARQQKFVHFRLDKEATKIRYYFSSNEDFIFGFFYDSERNGGASPERHHVVDVDKMEMITAPIRISARYHPESGVVACPKAGDYYLILCNKQSWLKRRSIFYRLEFVDEENEIGNSSKGRKATILHRTFSQ